MDPIDSWVFTCSSPAPGSRKDILGMVMNSLARRDAVPEIWLCCLDRFSQIFCTTEWSSSKWDTWADICKWNKQCSGDRLFEDEADNKDRNGKSWIINLRTALCKAASWLSPHHFTLPWATQIPKQYLRQNVQVTVTSMIWRSSIYPTRSHPLSFLMFLHYPLTELSL